jgi:GTP pyrophosphokinase
VTLDYTLHTGDQVEILTVNRGGPSRDWLNVNLGLVKSPRSRTKIKQWFKQQAREQNLENGKLLVEKEFKRLGLTNIDLNDYVSSFNVRTLEDLYVGIGCGDIPMGKLITRIEELSKPSLSDFDELIPESRRSSADSTSITVMGLSGLATNFARCCNPMPGDEIIGYITAGAASPFTAPTAECFARQRY